VRAPSHEDALAGTRAQYALLAEAVADLPDDAFAKPTRLEGWDVAALVAHLTRGAQAVVNRAESTAAGTPEIDALTYLSTMTRGAEGTAARAVEAAKGQKPAALRAAFAAAVGAATSAEAPLDATVPGEAGTIGFGEYLVTRCVESVVHALDLKAATGAPDKVDPTALKVAVRALAALVERAAPGKAVEVRVPGHVAFQAIQGPKHTRGTPGNVVECDPAAFVEVASGRVKWGDAVARGTIRGSGPRSDLTDFLPVIG
jgi:uncharacterized protein (TIGR03083 family)